MIKRQACESGNKMAENEIARLRKCGLWKAEKQDAGGSKRTKHEKKICYRAQPPYTQQRRGDSHTCNGSVPDGCRRRCIIEVVAHRWFRRQRTRAQPDLSIA